MLADGKTYREVAVELGYSGGNPGAVHRLVRRELEHRVVESAETLRVVEVDRLNALQVAVWDRAMAGDVAAVRTCRLIIKQRCLILGLIDRSATGRPAGDGMPKTLVVRADA